MLHWLNIELWGPTWPNVVVGIVFSTVPILWSHRKLKRHVGAQVDEVHKHLNEVDAKCIDD